MSEAPMWHLDLSMAVHETELCFDKWQLQMDRFRQLLQHHETYAPDAFRASLEEMMPEFRRATLAAVARLQIMAQIKSGEMRYHPGEPARPGDPL